jgi:organic hydroperoxide reductase OsmC/OhrA
LDGQGMPVNITVEVPDNATKEQIEAAIKKAEKLCATG